VQIWGGYMRAGVALIEEVERSPLDKLDLVYPILFCYRHGLELAMKWIVSQYGRYADLPNDEDTLHHDLWKLWKVCKKVILLVGSDGDSEGLRVVEQIVKDFHDFDQSSFALRYSENKNGALIALPDCRIDLQNVRKVMAAVDNFFCGADGQLDHNVSSNGRVVTPQRRREDEP
jgi:hypothetical protein